MNINNNYYLLRSINDLNHEVFKENWEINHSNVNNKIVSIIKHGNHLSFKIKDSNNKDREGPIALNEISLRIVNYIFKCKAVLEENDTITFSTAKKTIVLEDKEIHLIDGKDHLCWHVFFKSLNKSNQIPFDLTELSQNCSLTTKNYIKQMQCESLEKQIEFFKGFTVSYQDREDLERENLQFNQARQLKLEQTQKRMRFLSLSICGGMIGSMISPKAALIGISLATVGTIIERNKAEKDDKEAQYFTEQTAKTAKLFKKLEIILSIEPISQPSQIDNRVLVSKFMWAVTLVAGPEGSLGNHASIIIEGLNDGFYDNESIYLSRKIDHLEIGKLFMHKVHYLPQIKSKLVESSLFRYDERTQIWMIESSKVKQMLSLIEQEKSVKIPFNIKGSHSLLTKLPIENRILAGKPGHSCITWSIEKLKTLEIDIENNPIGLIATITKTFTKKESYYQNQPVIISI